MKEVQDILNRLEARRRELRMPCRALARISGLSLRTVQRALSGNPDNLMLDSLLAMAAALGLDIRVADKKRVRTVKLEQARVKARKLAAVAQGSSALEGQAIPEKKLAAIREHIEDMLIAGSPVRLWSEP